MAAENYSDKVSVNVNTSTLSEIDLLVDNGYYSNRSDFINQAIREALTAQRSTLDRIITRNERSAKKESDWFIGVSGFTARGIEEMYAEGEKTALTGYGVLHIDAACDREKLYTVVESIHVRGKVIAPKDVREHYGLK